MAVATVRGHDSTAALGRKIPPSLVPLVSFVLDMYCRCCAQPRVVWAMVHLVCRPLVVVGIAGLDSEGSRLTSRHLSSRPRSHASCVEPQPR